MLVFFIILPLAGIGAEKLAPFKPRGAKELENLPAKTSKDEGVFLVSEMFDLFATEVEWKYKNPELTALFKKAKPACMIPISKYPPSYFAEDAKIVYVDRDFKKGTGRTVAACANYVQQSLKNSGVADKFEGKIRTTLSIEDLMAFQQNQDFMKMLKEQYPNNIFGKYSFSTLAAGKTLAAGESPVAIQMGAPAPGATAPVPSLTDEKPSNKNPLIAFSLGTALALIFGVIYVVRSKRQTPSR
ncbi:hypothetical protein [Bdellovibrio bacteriovorus]|uniref:hypothetical protein n=1 Tax=Bdellovibrio bacteriovorus TaxID=959 RepID=UPI0012F8E550|nr:hypothetical protein [Bdellovibrio bacteriovorus]